MILGLALIAFGLIALLTGDGAAAFALIVIGGMIAWTFADTLRSRKIDSSVNNRIVAEDGHGRWLVEAKTSRQITGPRPYTVDNLPAHLTQVKKGLWVVDRNTSTVSAPGDPQKSITWRPADGNQSIEPRGNGHSNGFLSDVMEGFEHNYIKDNN